MVSHKLPELFSPVELQLVGSAGKPLVAGYSVYSYVRQSGKMPAQFTYNNNHSTDPVLGFNGMLTGVWLPVIDQLMKRAEKEDDAVLKDGVMMEYMHELSFEGSDYKFLVTKFPVKTEGSEYVFSTFRNVTFYLDCVDEIGSRKVLFSLVAENMTDVFCVVDTDARLVFMSASIRNLTGYNVEEIATIPLSSVLTPDSFEKLVITWEELRKPDFGIRKELFEIEFIRNDRVKRWAEITAASFAGPDGHILGVHALIRDISERKAMQEELRSSLEREIELSNVKSKYISTISHEFRTPLSIIYSNLQLLENHRFELDADTINDAFELSRMAVKSLLRVLDKVTVIDAVKKGKLEFRPAMSDLKLLCSSLVKDLNEMEMVPDRIDLEFGQIPDEIWIDESLFNHIFTNLLLNALKFSDKKSRVKFEVNMISPGVAGFTITDNGIGIPEDEMHYIFEPFYRASNSKHARGSGLGLTVVWDCLKLHRGEISFESKTGIGSIFKVVLPVAGETGIQV
ncbi:MAG: ATP-binding protein [Lentimicrobium sp.]